MEIFWNEKTGPFQLATVLTHQSRIGVPSQAHYLFVLKHKDSSRVYIFPLYFRCREHVCHVDTKMSYCKELDKVLKEVFGDGAEKLTPVLITNEGYWWGHTEGDPMADVKVMGNLFVDEYIVAEIRRWLVSVLIPHIVENKSEDEIVGTVSNFISKMATNLASTMFPAVDALIQKVQRDADVIGERVLSYLGLTEEEADEEEIEEDE